MQPFTLKEKPLKERGTYLVRIIASENDSVHVVSTKRYSKSAFEGAVVRDLRALLASSYDLSEFYPSEIKMPHADGDLHRLESLEIEYTDETGKIWHVEVDEAEEEE